MANENQVIAFLNHLKHDKRDNKQIEDVLLNEIVELARREGYEFSAADFRRTVDVHIYYDVEFMRWPITH